MQIQQSFEGFGRPPEPTDMLFFAVLPDAAAIENILRLTQGLRRAHRLHGHAIDAQKLHVSLRLLGYFPGVSVELISGIDAVASQVRQSPFRVTFDRVMSFAGKGNRERGIPLVLLGDSGVGGLKTLYESLISAMHHARVRISRGGFTPHLTLLYDHKIVSEQPVEPIVWEAGEFVLIHRNIKRGSPYIVAGRWPLNG